MCSLVTSLTHKSEIIYKVAACQQQGSWSNDFYADLRLYSPWAFIWEDPCKRISNLEACCNLLRPILIAWASRKKKSLVSLEGCYATIPRYCFLLSLSLKDISWSSSSGEFKTVFFICLLLNLLCPLEFSWSRYFYNINFPLITAKINNSGKKICSVVFLFIQCMINFTQPLEEMLPNDKMSKLSSSKRKGTQEIKTQLKARIYCYCRQ